MNSPFQCNKSSNAFWRHRTLHLHLKTILKVRTSSPSNTFEHIIILSKNLMSATKFNVHSNIVVWSTTKFNVRTFNHPKPIRTFERIYFDRPLNPMHSNIILWSSLNIWQFTRLSKTKFNHPKKYFRSNAIERFFGTKFKFSSQKIFWDNDIGMTLGRFVLSQNTFWDEFIVFWDKTFCPIKLPLLLTSPCSSFNLSAINNLLAHLEPFLFSPLSNSFSNTG